MAYILITRALSTIIGDIAELKMAFKKADGRWELIVGLESCRVHDWDKVNMVIKMTLKAVETVLFFNMTDQVYFDKE
ncbi:hypothetical protein JRQ81_013739 [Phrynocephalus forsythii]|uniref:Uncharacterized protein n=1 Tax=Phrynocephalus forsythii TaxID=171643 RepID=A0A9Q0Y0G4_9SAUR|nr:hypothetical protein JRQ81_013739 [Phrynocephalus forsythii]